MRSRSGELRPGPESRTTTSTPSGSPLPVVITNSRDPSLTELNASTALMIRFLSMRLRVYLTGVVRGLSSVSTTKTASSFAGLVLLALRLIEWVAFGGSDQLSPAL